MPNLHVAVPDLREGADGVEASRRALLEVNERFALSRPIHWFYTPMALAFAREMPAELVVYDCMDELSAFRLAPPGLRESERELLARADLVFTGGRSLFEAKRALHSDVHCFPSSVDIQHFGTARRALDEPPDQSPIVRPRLGYFGVIDERMDLELLRRAATARPGWQFCLVGPVVKIDPATLPILPNIHYLGPKQYAELPRYLAGWDVALMPFALNESTRFISPTKTLEYLAGGKPVVSTPVADVVSPYGDRGLVHIAEGADEFIAAIEDTLSSCRSESMTARVADFIAGTSWERTWAQMSDLMDRALRAKGRK